VKARKWIAALAVGVTLSFVPGASAADVSKDNKAVYNFGSLRTPTPEVARAQAEAWLKSTGKMDAVAFEKIWAAADRTVFDRIVDTLVLGSPDASKLLGEASSAIDVAPKEAPEFLKDAKLPGFFRSNLALAYARLLSNGRVYEESLEVLKTIQPENVSDPAAYFFHRAVAEHALMMKEPATKSITRLLDDVGDAPDRYKMVATLMYFDLQTWKKDEKDLSNIVKLMDNSERRLDLSRAGTKTQGIQKKIVFRLDEVIKELENQQNQSQCKGGNCPKGGSPGNGGGANPSAPMQDSNIATNGGPGNVNEQKLKNLAEKWGTLPEAERARAMQDITRDLPPRYREVIENYFKSLARSQPNR